MLLGEHEHSLDDKNRLTLPAKLREQLGDHVVITRGMDGCLYVYARPEFDQLAARIGSLDGLARGRAPMQRHFFVNATAAELDKQGRVVIPALLLEREAIGREVTVTGVCDHLEIWDRATWSKQLQEVKGAQKMLPSVLPTETDHVPVLADEVLTVLAPRPGETVIDCTFGAGGHSVAPR